MKSLAKKTFQTGKNFRALSYKLILMTAMLSTSAIPARADASQIELQRGIQSFNSKHYTDAVAHLQQYVASAPHESIGHYYLANCLFNLGYEKPCMDEYALALKESTSQKMTDYCRDAIRSMQASKLAAASPTLSIAERAGLEASTSSRSVPSSSFSQRSRLGTSSYSQPMAYSRPSTDMQSEYDPRSSIAFRSTSEFDDRPYGTRISNPRLALREPLSLLMRPAVSAYTVETGGVPDLALEKTLVRMNDQSNVEISTLQRNHAADLESLKEHLTDDIFRLNRDRDTRIQALQDGVRLKGSSSSDTVDSIRKDTEAKITTAKNTYQSTLEEHEDQFQEQIAKMQNDLRISQDQVADARRVPGNHPNLQLAGTDLYTRNFTPSPNPPPPDELVATPERLILDAHSRPGRTISRVVRDPSEPPPPPPGTDLKVHGQLLK